MTKQDLEGEACGDYYVLWGSDDGYDWTMLEGAETVDRLSLDQPYSWLMATGDIIFRGLREDLQAEGGS